MEQYLNALDDYINFEHSPDLQFNYILNKLEIFDNIDDELKLYFVTDIFRDVMQYVEEFGSYFLAYIKKENISSNIVKNKPKNVEDLFKNLRYDEKINEEYGFLSFNDLIINVFNLDKYNESIQNLASCINSLSYFFCYHLDLYNSIKHGFRVFDYGLDYFEDDRGKIHLNCKYFCSIGKKKDGNPYFLLYPLDALYEDSIKVLNDTKEIFSFLKKAINSYKFRFPLPNFDYVSDYSFSGYHFKITKGNTVIVLNNIDNMDIVENPEFKYFNISFKNNIFIFTSNENCSLLYPFSLKFIANNNFNLKPDFNHNYTISEICTNEDMDVSQLYYLKKLKNSMHDSKVKIRVLYNDDILYSGNLKRNINFQNNGFDCEDNILEALIKLNKITTKIIPVPYDLSENQKEQLLEESKKINLQKDAFSLLDNVGIEYI